MSTVATETKHTPGPWRIYDSADHKPGQTIDIWDGGDKWVGSALGSHVGPDTDEEIKANAALIAAAPEMLTAIQLAISIKDLWAPVRIDGIEHEGEAQALAEMERVLTAAIQKAIAG